MPALEVADLRQFAVLWPRVTAAPFYDQFGMPRVGDPEVIRCRWEWTKRTTVLPDGSTIDLAAIICLAQEITEGSRLYLLPAGVTEAEAYSYFTGTGSPGDFTDIVEAAVTLETTSDLKNRFIQRSIGCRRWKDTSGNT